MFLVVVRGPEAQRSDIREVGVCAGGDEREGIHREGGAVGIAEDIVAGGVEDAAGLQIILKIGERGVEAGGPARIDGILVRRGVKIAKVFQDAAGLRALARAQEVWNRDCGEERDDGNDDHDFHEREAATAGLHFLYHYEVYIDGRISVPCPGNSQDRQLDFKQAPRQYIVV